MAASSAARKLVIVTGANKGIGFEIVKGLLSDSSESFEVVLTSRNEGRAAEAVKKLTDLGLSAPTVRMLELGDASSRKALADWVEKERDGKLYCLVNNAAIAYKGSTFGADEAAETLRINLESTIALTRALEPSLVRSAEAGEHPRVVTIASRAGRLDQVSVSLQDRVRATDLTDEALIKMGHEYVEAIRMGTHESDGWSNSMYGVSKLLVIAWNEMLAREWKHKGIFVNCVCPGWCQTDMSSHSGPRTAEKGAETPIWLVQAPNQDWGEYATGGFYHDKRPTAW